MCSSPSRSRRDRRPPRVNCRARSGILHSSSSTPTKSFQLSEDLSLIRGNHQLGYGGSYIRQSVDGSSYINTTGPWTFSGTTTGMGLADFLIGRPATFQQGMRYFLKDRNTYAGLYVQDAWKVHPRLTLNLGLRYDLAVNAFANNITVQPFQQAGRPNDTKNFQPRLGFNFKVDNRTVVRGGAGLYYGDAIGADQSFATGNAQIVVRLLRQQAVNEPGLAGHLYHVFAFHRFFLAFFLALCSRCSFL